MEPPKTPRKGSSRNNTSLASYGDSPISKKHSPLVAGATYSVEASRTAVSKDLPATIPCFQYNVVANHVIPPLHGNINIPRIIMALVKAKVIVNGRWAPFPTDPWQCKQDEMTVFSGLDNVIQSIVLHSQIDLDATIKYVNRPTDTPVCSDVDHKKGARPDGYFLFLDHSLRRDGRHYWRDLLTPAEFKLEDKHNDLQDASSISHCAFPMLIVTLARQDINKICWDMHQIMKEDPRRRRVFGFTIENTQMRVWMMNRAEVIASEPFNFITVCIQCFSCG